MQFQGKTAIITGGTRGIGRAIALALGRNGCTVAFNYLHHENHAKSLKEQISTFGSTALEFKLDVGDFPGVKKMAQEVKATCGRIDILVNNAGILQDKALYTMDENDWDMVIKTNLKSVFNCTRSVITDFMKQGSGRVLNITSVSGLRGTVGQTNYAASKAGIVGFTRSLAREAGKFNVTVNAIAPGYIETDMIEGIPEERKKSLLSSIPLGRFGQADEVAQLALFLLSDEAGYITGQVIPIDGGLSV